MTSQTIIAKPATTEPAGPVLSTNGKDARLFETVKHVYKSDHQAEYLAIKAQVESLLQQLQTDIRAAATSTPQQG